MSRTSERAPGETGTVALEQLRFPACAPAVPAAPNSE